MILGNGPLERAPSDIELEQMMVLQRADCGGKCRVERPEWRFALPPRPVFHKQPDPGIGWCERKQHLEIDGTGYRNARLSEILPKPNQRSVCDAPDGECLQEAIHEREPVASGELPKLCVVVAALLCSGEKAVRRIEEYSSHQNASVSRCLPNVSRSPAAAHLTPAAVGCSAVLGTLCFFVRRPGAHGDRNEAWP
jgi:hypothetical protein